MKAINLVIPLFMFILFAGFMYGVGVEIVEAFTDLTSAYHSAIQGATS